MATDIRQLLPTNVRAALLAGSAPSSINPYVTASALSSFGFVPYTGATADVNLGAFSLTSPTIYGSTSASGTLTLSSTNNATKGKLLFGTSAYDEVNNRLGIGISSPAYDFDLTKSVPASYVAANIQNTSATGFSFIETLGDNNTTYSSLNVFNSAGGVGTFYDNNTAGVATNSATLSFLVNENASGGWVLTAGGFGTANEKQRWTINQTSFKQAAATSGAITTYTFTKPNNTGQTASTPINGFLFTTGNRQWATGAITTQKEFEITSPTYSFVGASTITNAYTMFVNAPTAGTNATITNNYALGTNGSVSFGIGATNPTLYLGQSSPDTLNYLLQSDGSNSKINGKTSLSFLINNVNYGGWGSFSLTYSITTANFSGGAYTGFTFTSPTNTNQTATTNIPNFKITGSNKQWATGTVANQYWNYLTANTASFVGASTITNSYGLFVEAATAGTNATITNNYAAGFGGPTITTVSTGNIILRELVSIGSGAMAIYMGTVTPSSTNYILAYDTSSVYLSAPGVNSVYIGSSQQVRIGSNFCLFSDGTNLQFNTTTGSKIATATTQKLAFWNATPIVQPTTAVAAAAFVANTSGIANDTATFDGYTIGQVVKALRNTGLLA